MLQTSDTIQIWIQNRKPRTTWLLVFLLGGNMRNKENCNIKGRKGFIYTDLSILINNFYLEDLQPNTTTYDKLRKRRERLKKKLIFYFDTHDLHNNTLDKTLYLLVALDFISLDNNDLSSNINYMKLLNNLLLSSVPRGEEKHINTRVITPNSMNKLLAYLAQNINLINSKASYSFSSATAEIINISESYDETDENVDNDSIFLSIINLVESEE